MAGSVEHMAVAVELLREDQRQQGSFLKLKDPVHFVLGNLAPGRRCPCIQGFH